MRVNAQLLILSGCLAAIAHNNEPSYHGRTLSEWLRDLDPHMAYEVNHPPPEVVAIRGIGTNALPLLIKWMGAKDPKEPPKPHLAECYNMTRSQRAAMAITILGETAEPAIPELTQLAMSLSSRDRYDRCIEALAQIGPAALPSFEIILTRGSIGRRSSAIESLPVLHTNAMVVLPAAVKCLAGNNEDLGWRAADALSRLDAPGSALVPLLTNALTSASAPARVRVLRCLFWLDHSPQEAVPAISAALTDRNPEVRAEATNALQRIAPEFLTRRAK
jgi:HEAT repeat protein